MKIPLNSHENPMKTTWKSHENPMKITIKIPEITIKIPKSVGSLPSAVHQVHRALQSLAAKSASSLRFFEAMAASRWSDGDDNGGPLKGPWIRGKPRIYHELTQKNLLKWRISAYFSWIYEDNKLVFYGILMI